ncbi:MAG: MptD family putative ECF transporter S component [Muricomes sp.]
METKTNKLQGRELITIGVFSAIYLVIVTIIGGICMPVPPLYLLMPAIIALLNGTVYMLFLAKVQRHGGIFILSLMPAILLMAMGHMWTILASCVLCGILAEAITGVGKFKSFRWNTIGYCVFSLNMIGAFIPIWVMREFFFADTLSRGMSAEFVDTLRRMTPLWVLFAMAAMMVIAAVLGAFIGKGLLKKHFVKAGIV